VRQSTFIPVRLVTKAGMRLRLFPTHGKMPGQQMTG
jgi:hypothetical protein